MKYIKFMSVVLIVVSVVVMAACGGGSDTKTEQDETVTSTVTIPEDGVITTESGLQYIEIEEGEGLKVKPGDLVEVHYTGTLEDGTKFDSSLDRGEPFEFIVGVGQVIEGWEQGLPGMKVGGKRKLTIPSSMGYGEMGSPPTIPGNAGLIFEIELIEIIPGN